MMRARSLFPLQPGPWSEITVMIKYAVVIAFTTLPVLLPPAKANVDLNFRGVLGAEPCNLSTDTQDQVVEFPSIARRAFKNNPRSAPKKFELKLLDCDLSLGESVKVTFYAEESSTQPGTFAMTDGDAQGIAIAIESASGEAVKPAVAMRPVLLTEEGNVLGFNAYIQGNDYAAIKEGEFSASVKFILEYQ